ncbi:MAG: Flp pilus assembly protein CpaB [Armatimonadota bacterium]
MTTMPFNVPRSKSGLARTAVLIVAGLLGLGTLVLVYAYLAKPGGQPEKLTPVVLAAVDISTETILSPGMVKLKLIPKSELQEDAATALSSVNGKVTALPLKAGEQIIAGSLVDKMTAFGLVAMIPRGTRAMTITVDSVDAVSGLLRPGDHVDVVASVIQGSDSVAKTILQDVTLLAVNANLQTVSRGEQVAPSKEKPPAEQSTATNVTIAVTPEEAERLVAAQQKGKLKLGLRGMGDIARAPTEGASLNRVMGSNLIPPERLTQPTSRAVVKVTPDPAAKLSVRQSIAKAQGSVQPFLPPALPRFVVEAPTVRVIKGTQVQDVEVRH